MGRYGDARTVRAGREPGVHERYVALRTRRERRDVLRQPEKQWQRGKPARKTEGIEINDNFENAHPLRKSQRVRHPERQTQEQWCNWNARMVREEREPGVHGDTWPRARVAKGAT